MKYIPFFLFSMFICALIVMADINYDNFIMTIGHSVKFGDKIGHFFLFGTLALLLNYALNFRRTEFLNRSFLVGSVLVLLFAITEEFSQLLFETRTFDFGDMFFDAIGVRLISNSYVVKLINGRSLVFKKE